jgi:hypothetical protein
MTHIVSPTKFKSKKAFKEAITANPHVYLDDPSWFDPKSGYIDELFQDFPGLLVTVTNHPKRSWFAAIKLNKGKITVT